MEELTTTQFKERFQITEREWAREREEILAYIRGFCEFEIVGETRNRKFIIYETFGEYQKREKKGKRAQNKEIYLNALTKVIKENPIQIFKTATYTVAQMEEIKKIGHAFGTSYSYTREEMKDENLFYKTRML